MRNAPKKRETGLLRKGGSRPFSGFVFHGSRGSAVFYVLIAVALLGALTYSFTRDTGANLNTQVANKDAQDLYVQANLIRAAISECTLSYPGGGGDLDGDGDVDTADNPNTPYPLDPESTLIPGGASGDSNNYVADIVCLKSDTETEEVFQATNSRGRFLPQPPAGWGQWVYTNDGDGVKITIAAPSTAAGALAGQKVADKFSDCQADYASSTLTVWIRRVISC